MLAVYGAIVFIGVVITWGTVLAGLADYLARRGPAR